MADEININEEYEHLFGSASIVDLFDADEDYYNGLRQQIINTPRDNIARKELPFAGIEVIPYIDMLLIDEINRANKNGYRVFILKKSRPGNHNYCNAAGYYIPHDKKFIILKYSHISRSESFSTSDSFLRNKRNSILKNKTAQNREQIFLSEEITCHDARIAACIVMAKRVEMNEWRDEKNKTPQNYYKFMELEEIDSRVAKTQIIIPSGITSNTTQNNSPITDCNHHLFYIKGNDYVLAHGYFDPNTEYFYICQGSTIEYRLQGVPSTTDIAAGRQRLIATCAKEQLFCWKLIKDAKCRNAMRAATYVLGRVAIPDEWKDDNGLKLSEVYPASFGKKDIEKTSGNKLFEENQNVSKTKRNQQDKGGSPSNKHLFFILRKSDLSRKCDATGYYDEVSKSFILLKDSLLSLEVSSSFRYSVTDAQRRLFINSNCIKLAIGYKLKKDVTCMSPNQASNFVIGDITDGYKEWKDKEGKTLGEFIKLIT